MELLIIPVCYVAILISMAIADKNTLSDSTNKLNAGKAKLLETVVKSNRIRIQLLERKDEITDVKQSLDRLEQRIKELENELWGSKAIV